MSSSLKELNKAIRLAETSEMSFQNTGLSRYPVLFVLPNFAGGGAERVAITLMASLNRRRFIPMLAVFEGVGPLRDLVPDDVPVHEIGQPRLRRALPAFIGLVHKIHPAAIFATHGYINLGLLLIRAILPRGIAIVVRESNTPSQSLQNKYHPRLRTIAYRLLYPTADTVFCQHGMTEQEMSERFHVQPSRIRMLPNPVDVVSVRAAAEQPRREPGQGLRFVAAGRLVRQKGFDRLLDIMPKLPQNCHVTIFGEGPNEKELRAKSTYLRLGERVHFAGFTNNLAQWLAGADACLVPSRWEGLPNVALEALSCGTPVIATPESGGVAELAAEVPSGAVSLAASGGAFASAMTALLPRHDASLRPSLLPRHYELSKSVAVFADSLERLCAG